MTDTLRTRIAAVLERNLAEQLFSDLPDRYYKWIGYDELADAVIRELGLRMNVEHRVAHYILTPPRGFLRKFDSRFRWVTGWSDWIADEESARPE